MPRNTESGALLAALKCPDVGVLTNSALFARSKLYLVMPEVIKPSV